MSIDSFSIRVFMVCSLQFRIEQQEVLPAPNALPDLT